MSDGIASSKAAERTGLGRRQFLAAGAAVAGGVLLPVTRADARPWFSVGRRGGPAVTSGVQAGDVSDEGAVIWARADRPGRLWVELERGRRHDRRQRGPLVSEATDFTGQVFVRDLPPGEQIDYRVWFEDEDGRSGQPEMGTFRSPPRSRRPVSFVWTGDCVGQGWGINPDWGGLKGFEAMRQTDPDFFVFSGDTVYADGPLLPEVTLPDGTVWRNIVTPEKSKVAETLDEYRGQWRYNLLDEHVRRFNAQVPVIVQWDDHEVTNNWYPGEILTDTGPDARYTVKEVDVLAARAAQAFHEYFPMTPRRPGPVHRIISYGPLVDVFVVDMRTYRGPNTPGLETDPSDVTRFLGAEQLRWLGRSLIRSRARWKIVAADMPIGLVVPDGPNIEAIAQGDGGPPLGRELEIAMLLRRLQRQGVANVVWVTADVHYTAAHHYDPARAAFAQFDPFWEFVSGPINAGTFGPNALESTFGPEAVFVRSATTPNQPPSAGLQFFGHVAATAESLAVTLRDIAGTVLHTTEIEALP